MWHRVAPRLAQRFMLVIADLPAYGWSAAPPAQPDHESYTKRAMARAMIEAMQTLGFIHFRLAGHDRGARPSRPAGAACGARHRRHLGHVAPHGRTACHTRLALDVSGSGGAIP
jgi:pimeloyl-ACP methyl ester carboxylesterase